MSCAAYRLRPALRKGRQINHCTNPRPSRTTGTHAALGPLPPVEAWFQTPEPTWGEGCDRRARAAIRSLLAGRPRLQPIRFDTYAEWASVITIMAAAYSTYGAEGARGIYTILAGSHPQLPALVDLPAGAQPILPIAPRALATPNPRCANGGELLHGIFLEVCNILDFLPTVVERIFGAGMRERIETWSSEIHPRHTRPPTPGAMHRAWVWLPNESRPRLYPIDGAGIIWLHDLAHPASR